MSFVKQAFISGVFFLLLLYLLFCLFQNESIYNSTLGKISFNYERIRVNGELQINQVSKPFRVVTNNSVENFDADIYKNIKENGYSPEGDYQKAKGAFFPLFPFVWKVLHVNSITICIINFLIFIFAIALLVGSYFYGTNRQKLKIYIFCISLPSIVIYLIPYSEALFILTACIGIYGLLKNNYKLYFSGMMLLSITRPASVFVLAALIFALFIFHLQNKRLNHFIKELWLKTIPFLTGYFIVLLIQYIESGSMTLLLDAGKEWEGKLQWPHSISDWSIEGFGLSTFALFSVGLPSIIYSIIFIFRKSATNYSTISPLITDTKKFILLTSAFYISGITLFVFFNSSGNLHSFFRFTLCSPFFFVILLYGTERLKLLSNKIKLFYLLWVMISIITFLTLTEYGGSRFSFSFVGLYLFILYGTYFLFHHTWHSKMQNTALAILILGSSIWIVYLFNMFVCEGWTFT